MSKKQLQNGSWHFKLSKFTIISFMAVCLCPAIFAQKAKRVEFFHGRNSSLQIADFNKMKAPNATSRKLKLKDYGNEELGNPLPVSFGYQFGWLNHASHLSFIGEIGWNYWHFITQQADEADNGHNIHALKPGASLMYHIGNFTTKKNKVRGLISVGANYNWNFKYKSAISNDKSAINSGISSVYGIGFEYLNYGSADFYQNGKYIGSGKARLYFALLLKYERSHYNFFNSDYSLNDIYIFEDWKSNFGALYLSVIHKF